VIVPVVAGIITALAVGLVVGWLGSNWRAARPVAAASDTSNDREVADLRAAIDGLPLAVVLVGQSVGDRWRNAAARSLLGSGRVEALLDAAMTEQRENALTGRSGSQIIEIVGPPKRTYSLGSVPIRSIDGEGLGLVTVSDLTEMVRLERVRRELIANVSHELRTPVGAMAVLAETLQDETDPAVAARLTDKIVAEAHRLSRTITDLLELSVLESSGHASTGRVSCSALARDAANRVESSAAALDVLIDTTGVSPSHALKGDVAQLASAIGNLLENAVKYSNRGGTVTVSSTNTDAMVTIAVADNGVGIPVRDIERVFERFYRVDTARSRVTGGTGLGLAIVRHVAENHGGSVSVESIEGKGSTFRLTVPAAPGGDV
jgi:two-component system, OmpR family, sensor histidine kinase SenX3